MRVGACMGETCPDLSKVGNRSVHVRACVCTLIISITSTSKCRQKKTCVYSKETYQKYQTVLQYQQTSKFSLRLSRLQFKRYI